MASMIVCHFWENIDCPQSTLTSGSATTANGPAWAARMIQSKSSP